jgi:transposase
MSIRWRKKPSQTTHEVLAGTAGGDVRFRRRVTTRHDKLAASYLAFDQLASIGLRLLVNESTS